MAQMDYNMSKPSYSFNCALENIFMMSCFFSSKIIFLILPTTFREQKAVDRQKCCFERAVAFCLQHLQCTLLLFTVLLIIFLRTLILTNVREAFTYKSHSWNKVC